MAMMVMLLPQSLKASLDVPKCMTMCLIHDMAESLVGDITPADGVPKMEKSRRETLAMEYITDHLFCGKEIRSIWQEHEESATMESRIVHDLDKVELLLQMVEYEKRGQGKIDLGEFAYVATKVYLPEMKDWAQDILQERENFWAQKDIAHSEAKEESKRMQDQYYDGK
jgi:putative hydrolase of HD superfamily